MRNPTTVSDADLYGDMHREPSGEVERVARAIANARIEHARLKTKPSEDFETLEHYLARAAIQALRVEPPYEPDGSDAPIRDSVEPPSDVAGLVERLKHIVNDAVRSYATDLSLSIWIPEDGRPLTIGDLREAADTLLSLQHQIAERDEVLREARDRIAGLQCQFDHQGCTCTFPSDDCCSFAKVEATLAKLSALIGNEGVSDG
jgi:hypothetical protein